VIELAKDNSPIPSGLTRIDLGCDVALLREEAELSAGFDTNFDEDVDFGEGAGLLKAARRLQRASERYWMLEYVRRLKESNPSKKFQVLVLGCTNPARRQYAIYVYELGLEWKYISPVGSLQAGTKFSVKISNVLPHNGQLTFTRHA
jgi:hypothetical protein